MRVGDVAYVRTGDKGDVLNVSCTPIDPADFGWLADVLTADRVAMLYAPVVDGDVTRYELPGDPRFQLRRDPDPRRRGVALAGQRSARQGRGTLLAVLDIGDRPEA